MKRIILVDERLSTITCLGAGINDGIHVNNAGNYLVSHWEGQVFRIPPSGDVVEILDTSRQDRICADFEFVKDSNLLVIPTFLGNTVAGYRLQS